MFAFYREFAASLPDDLTTQVALVHAPGGSGAKLCGVAVCHAGEDAARAEAGIGPLRRFGSPLADMLERMPYPLVNTGIDWLFPKGAFNYWKSAFLTGLCDAAVATMTAAFERRSSAHRARIARSPSKTSTARSRAWPRRRRPTRIAGAASTCC